MMTRLLEQLLSDAVYCVASRIRYAACNVGDINQIIQQTVSYIRSEYLKPKLHGTTALRKPISRNSMKLKSSQLKRFSGNTLSVANAET